MTPYTFDTLGASKQLREAGMSEGVAEAVVAVFQHATSSIDFGQLATRADIADMATKADLERFATKTDLERFATREDLHELSAKLGERMMAHTLALGGLVVTLFGGLAAIMVMTS